MNGSQPLVRETQITIYCYTKHQSKILFFLTMNSQIQNEVMLTVKRWWFRSDVRLAKTRLTAPDRVDTVGPYTGIADGPFM